MLPDQEAAATGEDSKEQPRRAEVAVGDPQVAGLDSRQHLVNQRPLLGVGVLAGHDVNDQHRGRVKDHQRLPRQGGGASGPGRRNPMLGSGQVVAVKDLGAIARHRSRQDGVEFTDEWLQPAGRVPDQSAADARFDSFELFVNGRQRRGDLAERGEVSGANRGLDPEDDGGHQVDDRREEQLAGVLIGGLALEEAVQLARVQSAFQQRAIHHGNWCLLEKSLEGLAKLHSRRPCEPNLSSYQTASYQ